MGILDGIDPELLKLLQGGQATDKKAPLNAGLLAAGLGMLANAHRGAAGGIGTGGLLGLDAYNQAMQAQKKDPMQQISMLNAVMGLNEKAQNQQAMQGFRQEMAQPQGPPPLSPDTSDFMSASQAPPGPSPYATAQHPSRPSLEVLEKYMTNPATASMVGPLIKHYYPDVTLSPGAVQMRGGVVQASNPDPEKPQLGAGGVYDFAPGVVEAKTRQARGIAAAQAEAEARYRPVETRQGRAPVTTTALRLEQSLNGQPISAQSEAAPPKDVLTAMDELKRRGVATRWTPQAGLVMGDAALQPPEPQARLGVGVPASELAADKALAEQKALAPGVTQAEFQKHIVSKTVERLQEVSKAADEATMAAPKLARVMDRIAKTPEGIYGGAAANTVLGFAKWLNAVGIQFDSKRFADSQESAAYLDSIGLGMIKQFVGSQNISDADRVAVMSIVPRLPTDPNARWEMLSLFADINDRRVADARQFREHVKGGGTIVDYPDNWLETTDPQAVRAPMSLDQARANQQKRQTTQQPEKPPMMGAEKAPDGKWYLKSGSKYYRVEQ
jgi:hypothetical protein